MFYKSLLIFIISLFVSNLYSQELSCNVEINHDQVIGVDKKVFEALDRDLTELLNSTSWTGAQAKHKEKIKCHFILTLQSVIGNNNYQGTIQVLANRPVFNSTYLTPLINHKDTQVLFNYLENKSFKYENAGKNNEIVAIVAFYANLIIGLESDTFKKKGGTRYYKNALDISLRQDNGEEESGWSPSERKVNRYWIIEDLLNYTDLRETLYSYHREGLDKMVDDPKIALKNIVSSLFNLKNVHRKSTDAASLHMFFDAKAKEITECVKALAPKEKKEVYKLVGTIDPGHLGVYKALE